MLMFLAASPFWGRVVDRYGSRPVLIACTVVLAPVPLIWIWMTSAAAVYAAVAPLNLLVGFVFGGTSVAVNTLIYKLTPSAGRSVQLAIYATLVVLGAAPMPALGGYLPEVFKHFGIQADLRLTFYLTIPFVAGAAWMARGIAEPGARSTLEMIRSLRSAWR
jgi:MFS family permease